MKTSTRSVFILLAATLGAISHSTTADVARTEPVPPSAAGDYTFEFINAPGASRTYIAGINNRGEMVGSFLVGTDTSTNHGFVLAKRVISRVDIRASEDQGFTDINDRGQIIGYYRDKTFFPFTFLLDRWRIEIIEVPGAAETGALGVNDLGQIVGAYSVSVPGEVRAFLKDDDVFKTYAVQGAVHTRAHDISKHGRIVGTFNYESGFGHSFRIDNDVITIIRVPGATRYSAAFGINDRGQIVGRYGDDTGDHGYLLDNGVFKTIDNPACNQTTLEKINLRGDIVGTCVDDASRIRGFIARKNP